MQSNQSFKLDKASVCRRLDPWFVEGIVYGLKKRDRLNQTSRRIGSGEDGVENRG